MQTLATRLSFPAAAILAAGLVTATPAVTPPTLSLAAPSVVRSVSLPKIQLTASVLEILELPALKQWVINQIDDLVTLGVGLAKAGEGVGKTIRGIPEFVTTLTKQVFSGDLLGALTTIEVGLIGAVTIIGGPILASIIERRQRSLAVSEAMQEAVPAALIGLGTGLVAGFDDFARSVIIAGQNLVDSLLPINIGNVLNALVDGVKLIAEGLGDGAQKIIDGVVFAQQTIAEALATQPMVMKSTTLAGSSAPAIDSVPTTADDAVVTLKVGSTEDKKVAEDVTGTSTAPTSSAPTSAATTSTAPTSSAPTSAAPVVPPASNDDTDVIKSGNKFEPGTTVEDKTPSGGTTTTTTTTSPTTESAPPTATTAPDPTGVPAPEKTGDTDKDAAPAAA